MLMKVLEDTGIIYWKKPGTIGVGNKIGAVWNKAIEIGFLNFCI